jgi:hypothetical protein
VRSFGRAVFARAPRGACSSRRQDNQGSFAPLAFPPSETGSCSAIKNILEPIFEADFYPVSYGFRPGKSAHGALHPRCASVPRGPVFRGAHAVMPRGGFARRTDQLVEGLATPSCEIVTRSPPAGVANSWFFVGDRS